MFGQKAGNSGRQDIAFNQVQLSADKNQYDSKCHNGSTSHDWSTKIALSAPPASPQGWQGLENGYERGDLNSVSNITHKLCICDLIVDSGPRT